ncbi:hypothetical protein GUITHDRAFT_145006 [Guillardia theta CCMP2712]|uniref:SPRY domain-containing protein n=1 Tax=Guillardia theta (strain CCMP2712) TaxID=905079 RepID=L1INH0_GUITC|nr:hypothetical protein GUITHDRAFT_145006 [Guillardia theta CCMP2712]EKX37449.1 hypothetical protein GUITHDRAFT_145006 [Guillardia theta CCMP2712]|eukprot:XP_005824429.1 hypothetical protein GUITHDRAFT_145006 [Guillardia theta CCMP2712]
METMVLAATMYSDYIIEDQMNSDDVRARKTTKRSDMSSHQNGKPKNNGKLNGSTSMDIDEQNTWYKWEPSSMKVSGATLLKEKDTPKFAAGLLNFELGFAFKPLVWEFSIKRSGKEWIGVGVVDSSIPLDESLRQRGSETTRTHTYVSVKMESKRDLAWFYHDRGFLCRGEHIEDTEVEPFQWDHKGICRIGVHFDYQNAELRFSCNGQDVKGKLGGVQGPDLYPAVYSSGSGTTFCCTAFPSQFGLTCRRSNFEGRNPPTVKSNLLRIAHESLEKQRRREDLWTNFDDHNDQMLSEGFQTPLQSWTPNDSDTETPRADTSNADVLVQPVAMAEDKTASPGFASKKKLSFETSDHGTEPSQKNVEDGEEEETPIDVKDISVGSDTGETQDEASAVDFDESEAVDMGRSAMKPDEQGTLSSLTSAISKEKAKMIVDKISHLQILEQIICAGLHAGGKSEEEAQHCKTVAGETTSEEEEPYLRNQAHVGQMNQQVNASNGSILENRQQDYGPGKPKKKTRCFTWMRQALVRTREKNEEMDYFCSDDRSR